MIIFLLLLLVAVSVSISRLCYDTDSVTSRSFLTGQSSFVCNREPFYTDGWNRNWTTKRWGSYASDGHDCSASDEEPMTVGAGWLSGRESDSEGLGFDPKLMIVLECINLSLYLSQYLLLSVCLSVCLPACLPACLSVCLSVSACVSWALYTCMPIK